MKGRHKAAIAVAIATVTVLLLLAVTSALLPQPIQASPDPEWWDTDWDYRKRLTFDNSGQTENLVDFPVLVKLTPANFNYAYCESDGKDIKFIDADDLTELDYHFEQWTYDGTSWIWVEVPQIDGGSYTDYIWLYYGNSAATPAQDEAGTYDANFTAVWHLEEISGNVTDSTAYGNNGSVYGDTIQDATGKIDGADDFDGDQDGVDIPSSSGDELSNFSQFTLEAWIDIDTYDPLADIVGKSWNVSETDPRTTYALALGDAGDNNTYITVTTGGTRVQCFSATDSISTTGLYYVVGTWNGTYLQNYINGEASGAASPKSGTINQNDVDVSIARYTGGWPGTYDLDGVIDEVRISDVARSADWIKAQYLSMTDNFITYSDIEFTGWGWCPDEERGIGDVSFPVIISAVPRADAPDVSDIRFAGTLTLTYPDTTVRTFTLNLTGVKTRSLFYLMQHEFDINESAWGASFDGAWFTWNESGVERHYIGCIGTIWLPHGDIAKTVKPYYFLLRTPDAHIPAMGGFPGDYVGNLEYIIRWVVKGSDMLITELSATSFWDVVGDVLDKTTVIIREVRDELQPYIP